MKIKLWGVRGSSPTPLTPDAVRTKIAAVIQRVKPTDLVSPESKELFLAGLPEYLFGTTGGNTACVEARVKDNEVIVFDCGTGLREMERSIRKHNEEIKTYHIFFTHFHYDHLLGCLILPPCTTPNRLCIFIVPIRKWSRFWVIL